MYIEYKINKSVVYYKSHEHYTIEQDFIDAIIVIFIMTLSHSNFLLK